MALSINNNMMAANTARTLNAHYGRLATSTQRLSSGLRINGAADDAAGLGIRELMRANVAALHQGIRNANDAISMIQVVDGALGIIDEKLIRMKELAEQAATGTYDSTQRLMIDSEFQAMASEIQRIAIATDFNGIKLLDGTHENKIPSSIILNNPIKNIRQESNTTSSKTWSGSSYIDEYITKTITSIEETTEYYINDGKLYKTIELNSTKEIITDYNRLGVGGISGGITDEFGREFASSTGSHWQTISLLNADAYDISQKYEDDVQSISQRYNNPTSSYYIYEDDPNVYANGWPDVPHCYFFNFDLNNDGVDDMRWAVMLSSYRDINWVKDNIHVSSINPNSFNVRTTHTTNPTVTTVSTEEINFDESSNKVKIHFGPMNDSAEDYYYIEKRDCTLKGLGLENVRVETQDNAQKALGTINDAIVKKDQARAYYGAMQNRLENTITNLTTQAENLQAAESRISDVDVATEMTNFVRNQILTQSAVSMLAQANSLPQMAMQLIGG